MYPGPGPEQDSVQRNSSLVRVLEASCTRWSCLLFGASLQDMASGQERHAGWCCRNGAKTLTRACIVDPFGGWTDNTISNGVRTRR